MKHKTSKTIALLALLASSTAFFSCTKEEMAPTDIVVLAKDGGGASDAPTYYLGITPSILSEYVAEHNTYLDAIFDIYNFEAEDYEKELTRCYEELFSEEMTWEDMEDLIGDTIIIPTDMDGLHDFIFSSTHIQNPSAVWSLITSIDTTFIDTAHYSTIVAKVDSMQYVASTTLSDADWLVAMGFAEMVKTSSYYWISKDNGGDGYGYSLLTDTEGNIWKDNKQPESVVGKAALKDCTTMAVGCVVTAAVGSINPALGIYALQKTVKKAAGNSVKAALITAVKNNLIANS